MNAVYNLKNDNEWYTFEKDVEQFVNNNIFWLANLTIWCPFDNKDSAFVKVLKNKGFNVIFSHTDNDKDFYSWAPPTDKYDLIMSNPPFRGKDKLLKRLIELNKPFAMIFGAQCFNSGKFINLLDDVHNLQFQFVSKRMKFHKGDTSIKTTAPPFHSLWICNNPHKQYDICLLQNGKYK